MTNPPSPPEPAELRGVTLATFHRKSGREMLRVSLDRVGASTPFINLRVWEPNSDNHSYHPAKGRGCGVRLGEIDALIEALQTVQPLLKQQAELAQRQEPGT